MKDLMKKKEEKVGAFIESLVDGALPLHPHRDQADQDHLSRNPDHVVLDPKNDQQSLGQTQSPQLIRIVSVPHDQGPVKSAEPGQVIESIKDHVYDTPLASGKQKSQMSPSSFPGISDLRESLRPHYASLPVIPLPAPAPPAVRYDPDSVFDQFFQTIIFQEPTERPLNELEFQDQPPAEKKTEGQTLHPTQPVVIIPWGEKTAQRPSKTVVDNTKADAPSAGASRRPVPAAFEDFDPSALSAVFRFSGNSSLKGSTVRVSVGDPNLDPHVFGPPGSGTI
jgi:hypothetical protein